MMRNTSKASDGALRVAVVGCQVGTRHARAFQRLGDRFQVVAACDTHLPRARALAEEIGGAIEIAPDYSELLARGGLDIVSICTPPGLHFRHILQGLDAGCHVVCEKPLVGSLRDLDAIGAAATGAGRRILPIFQMRFGAGVQKLKRLVDLGLAGRCYLSTIETAWIRGPEYYAVPWRRSWRGSLGGCLLGHAVHAHDILSHILGPVARVCAFAKTLVNPIETEDCVSASLEMADGSLATLSVTLGSAREISRLRFCFERLVAESNTHPYEYSGDPWTFTGNSPEIDHEVTAALEQFRPGPEGYDAQFIGLHEALRCGCPCVVTLEEARASIELASALYTSARQSRVVELPIGPHDPVYHGWEPGSTEIPDGIPPS